MPVMRKKKSRSNRSPWKRTATKQRMGKARVPLKKLIQNVVQRGMEVKQSNYTSSDGTQIFHNNFIDLDTEVLKTTPGSFDPMTLNTLNRIGDKILLKGVSLKFMFELNERYSDVTFRIMVIRCAKGDVPTRSTLFVNLSGNKMLDTVNRERYTILAQKFFKIQAPRMATYSTGVIPPPTAIGAGLSFGDSAHFPSASKATRLIKMWIPGKSFAKNRTITYENESGQVKFFDYRVLVYAYANGATAQDLWAVGAVNDYVKQMFYQDP